MNAPAGAARVFLGSQEWMVSWHPPGPPPDGAPHGSTGVCVTPGGEIVLVSHDGERWDFPAGRPEAGEDPEETLRREVLEEACATVVGARLLGYTRGRCVRGREEGLVLVRAFFRAEVELSPWEPRFEIGHRRLVSPADAHDYAAAHAALLPFHRHALAESGFPAASFHPPDRGHPSPTDERR